MTQIQLDYLDKLEVALATMVFDGHKKWAMAFGPVVEWLQRGEPVTAVLEADYVGLSPAVIETLSNMFDVRKFA